MIIKNINILTKEGDSRGLYFSSDEQILYYLIYVLKKDKQDIVNGVPKGFIIKNCLRFLAERKKKRERLNPLQ
jgi:hypothetical protein